MRHSGTGRPSKISLYIYSSLAFGPQYGYSRVCATVVGQTKDYAPVLEGITPRVARKIISPSNDCRIISFLDRKNKPGFNDLAVIDLIFGDNYDF